MDRIDGGLRFVFWAIVLVVLAVIVAQNMQAIISILLGLGLLLVIAKLLWPSRRSRH